MVKLSLFFFLATIASVNAMFLPRDTSGITATVESENVFCSFLPSKPGESIGESEDDAIAFCTQESPKAPGAKLFPDGFIVSSHFKATDDFVQVTGKMDGSKAGLDPKDEGGQYDSVGAPPGATCAGFKKFVNLVEPNDGIYCIRCCHNAGDCNTGQSEAGCRKIIPGDYS
jgi:hypothetical protein